MSKEEQMKILILKQTVASKKNVRRGDSVEVGNSEGHFLIRIKKAAPYSKELEAELAKDKKEAAKDDKNGKGKGKAPVKGKAEAGADDSSSPE